MYLNRPAHRGPSLWGGFVSEFCSWNRMLKYLCRFHSSMFSALFTGFIPGFVLLAFFSDRNWHRKEKKSSHCGIILSVAQIFTHNRCVPSFMQRHILYELYRSQFHFDILMFIDMNWTEDLDKKIKLKVCHLNLCQPFPKCFFFFCKINSWLKPVVPLVS